MTLRLIQLPGSDAFIDDGETAVRLSDVTKLSNYNPTGDLAGMAKYELRHGGFGYIAAPLADVLALFASEDDVPEPSEEEMKERRAAAAKRHEEMLFRSA